MTQETRRGPVLIELGSDGRAPRPDPRPFAGEEPPQAAVPHVQPSQGASGAAQADRAGPTPNPADAPLIGDDPGPLPQPRTMEMMMRLTSGGPSRLTRFFLQAGGALLTFLLSVAALQYISNLLTRYPLLGWVGVALFAAFTLAALGMALREWLAWRRFARIDGIQRDAGAALAAADLGAARRVADRLQSLFAGRDGMEWGRTRLRERQDEALDAETLLALAETELLAPLDQAARREIEAAARTVAATTALVPLAFADVAAALAANLRMIRRIAEIYGGRAGTVGGWRLARMVMTHLVATGAVAAGDDLIHTVAGGGILARLSKRFGEGVVNGALTARVGIAAMEVCRPLPFMHQPRPKVGNLLTRGLKGLFGEDDSPR
ncbi:MAG: TIGR01620 family protein [Paracoccus sp. (in: a-proteobacteria)]|uniref:TIGR01620 family protein n=1 Tax=Paracoccus sp. TaxID=267 RepID=UPI0026DEDF2D|nr:TIGR01620 family protein [Paracoccus sp. (in: a-proteobacteria)]MDO5611765.1 TIGR01620 family protein [Paracoccus sp. (in: a-proteobacteria)]